ncbi:MAG TPA: phosphatidylglycerophosphatase A [Pyrinomonadaceae bacterium]|nr:phosphatidylglycerophosphatase A [Chloracidobacterium sp.]MBP9934426.1 phosphatidylglycerophosphatase A [Pyrinomonadaceae bacterium]MBK7802595.1 phosphatidylglycerophosphatase A [Chloracidobacterium sp.]MBK9766179.1 phosphatidylglycerophosphatase A [Chloracidobacterium sp.]MBL0240116.1 phosphatidylglycerophosphatase A [Chloracidobacterium sp.]
MKSPVDRRKPNGVGDLIALGITTCGVGYLPLMPGTFGSMVGVVIYLGIVWVDGVAGLSALTAGFNGNQVSAVVWAANSLLLALLILIGIWASGRAIPLLGDLDPSEAVVDEVMGQIITLLFVPLGVGLPFVLAGFLLFRLFDIWKPYPIDSLQYLPVGVGICADDIVAGVYAGLCLALGYAVFVLI